MKLRTTFIAAAAAAAMLAPITASAADTVRLTIAAGHPEILLWVRHLKETFIPTVNAELAKHGEIEIEWTEGYGGTIVKLGSEVEAFQTGIIDVGHMSGVFSPAELGLLNLSYAMPFGPEDPETVGRASEAALRNTPGALDKVEAETGITYIGGAYAIGPYNIGAKMALNKVSDLDGVKVGGAGPNLGWLGGTGAVGVQGSLNSFYNDTKTGVYDAYIAWVTAAVPLKLYEPAPYWNRVGFGGMYVGGLGVATTQWETFSDETKAAFHKGAEAFSAAFFAAQDAQYEAFLAKLKEAGATVVDLPAEERAMWIADFPNPTKAWIAAAEARGEPAVEVLKTYQAELAAKGFTFERDYLAE